MKQIVESFYAKRGDDNQIVADAADELARHLAANPDLQVVALTGDERRLIVVFKKPAEEAPRSPTARIRLPRRP